MSKRLARLFIAAIAVTFATACSAYCRPKPHYTFVLPDGYVGWIQIVFNDPEASHLPIRKDGGRLIDVPESGVPRTSDIRVVGERDNDEFYYRVISRNETTELRRLPAEYVLSGVNHGGWDVMDTGNRGPGYSWFIFIGPPEIRAQTPRADITKEPGYGRKLMAPEVYPSPGRLARPADHDEKGGNSENRNVS